MIRTLHKMLLAVLCLAIFGCSSVPNYPNYMQSNASCIKGDVANFFKFFSDGEAHVAIREIDDVPTEAGTKYFCVAPGKHRVGVSAVSGGQMAVDYVELEFEPNAKYWLRAKLRGISMVFELYDVSRDPMVKSTEFKLKVGPSGSTTTIPIFIPSN